MIPKITNLQKSDVAYIQYCRELRQSAFKGDVEAQYSSRLLCATDNSVYQCMPSCVIFPKDAEDIAVAVKLRNTDPYKKLIITARGGGTGTNGQSLNRGIVVDCSRYMKGVSDFSEEKREVRVQSGVIKDELNDFLKDYKLFFSPELSTSNRATIGGMIANDAAGQGSLKYGRTSTHIKSVKVVLLDGTITTFGPVSGDELKQNLKKEGLEGEIYRKCYKLLVEKREEVEEIFPDLNRFMTGYDMYHAYDPNSNTLNLARLICGAEGTLAIVAEAVLDLTLMPAFRELLVVKYENFDSALRHAVELIDAGAFSVETVDSKVLNLAKQDQVWLSVQDYISDVPDHEIQGVNIVEFSGQDVLQETANLDRLYQEILRKSHTQEGGIIGVQIAAGENAICAVYGMRKKAVGLLGAAAGKAKLVPFTEDTVVPPKHLADYIKEFRALLDSMQVPYGMFGHVDTGLMHVRPALDLTTDTDRQKLVDISNGVVELVNRYHGQMWGEHGRGYRACYGKVFFKSLYESARAIKEYFDADNILNPGKICTPLSNDYDSLVAIDGLMRGDLDRTIPESVRENFKGALSCNGNGQCFSYQDSALMCPSYRYSKNHVRSPKGYSELMRSWLKMLNDKGYNPSAGELDELANAGGISRFVRRVINTLSRKQDYSTEYLEQISTCLSCKSCKSICPAHVNAADLNSRFLSMYYGRYLRPPMDLMILNSEKILPLLAKYPAFVNFVLQNKLVSKLTELTVGLIDLPKFNKSPLIEQCEKESFGYYSAQEAKDSVCEVVIVTDAFTNSYDADGLMDLARVVRGLGFKVCFLKPYINGKLMVIRGDRRSFVQNALKQAARLEMLHKAGKTLIGYDPALTICYRDEYRMLLGSGRGDFEVLLPEEWIEDAIATERCKSQIINIKSRLIKKLTNFRMDEPYYLFTHCTEKALVPVSVRMWQLIFKNFGMDLIPVPVSCCGMAGLHGHIAAYRDETYRVYESCWKKEIARRPFERCLVTGFSCRSQVYRMEHKQATHPLGIIANLIYEAGRE